MSYFTSKPLTLAFTRAGALTLSILSGVYVAFISQASSPDYRRLFWSIMPVALFHFAVAAFYFVLVRRWTRWVAFSFVVLVLAFFGEMTYRVWL